jgi:hypothetical protein
VGSTTRHSALVANQQVKAQMSTNIYCLSNASYCLSLSDWKDVASILGTTIAVPSVLFAAYKTYKEVQRSREQRQSELEQKTRDHLLRRTEFTLAQHRRLFDDPVLASVLRLIDGDPVELRKDALWDSKRKFLTFFEELALLVNSGHVDKHVAYYMFGYYAICAHRGINFQHGIQYDKKYWGLFMSFAEDAEHYLQGSKINEVDQLRM